MYLGTNINIHLILPFLYFCIYREIIQCFFSIKHWQLYSIRQIFPQLYYYIYILLLCGITYICSCQHIQLSKLILHTLIMQNILDLPFTKAFVKNMTIKSSLFKFLKECCHFLFIFIYFRMVQATSVQPVFDMKAQLALYVSVLGHKITFDSNTALHILICQQHSYYKLTRGAVLNFYIASSYSYYFILFAHETLFIFTVTDMLNLRFSLKIYIFKFMIINFYRVSLRIAQKILSYIIYVRFIGHIWTVTGLNIIMQKLATFALHKSHHNHLQH